jgi:hypothetical protein
MTHSNFTGGEPDRKSRCTEHSIKLSKTTARYLAAFGWAAASSWAESLFK